MSRRTVLIPTIQGNGAAGMKTVNLPGGFDYITTERVGSSCTAADVSQVQTLVNGQAWRTITGTDQDSINQSQLIAAMSVDYTLKIAYEQPRMKSIIQQYALTLNTDAPSAGAGGAYINALQETWTDSTTDNWTMWAEVDDNSPMSGTGGVERISKWTLQFVANNNFSSSIAPYIQGATGQAITRWLKALYVLVAAGTLANGETRIVRGQQGQIMFDRLAQLNVRLLTDAGVREVPTLYETSGGGMIIDTTESAIGEYIDTMQPAAQAGLTAGNVGVIERDGELLAPYQNFDIRFSPTNTGSGTALLSSVGYVA